MRIFLKIKRPLEFSKGKLTCYENLPSLGTVYTDSVSFVTASVSMRLHLSFTRRRSSSLSEPGRFENALKSGAFSKRYGFIGRVNGETAPI